MITWLYIVLSVERIIAVCTFVGGDSEGAYITVTLPGGLHLLVIHIAYEFGNLSSPARFQLNYINADRGFHSCLIQALDHLDDFFHLLARAADEYAVGVSYRRNCYPDCFINWGFGYSGFDALEQEAWI